MKRQKLRVVYSFGIFLLVFFPSTWIPIFEASNDFSPSQPIAHPHPTPTEIAQPSSPSTNSSHEVYENLAAHFEQVSESILRTNNLLIAFFTVFSGLGALLGIKGFFDQRNLQSKHDELKKDHSMLSREIEEASLK